jgi:hypothetical protein
MEGAVSGFSIHTEIVINLTILTNNKAASLAEDGWNIVCFFVIFHRTPIKISFLKPDRR